MGYLLRIIIFCGYNETWWTALIPFYSEYVLATLACSPIFFWLYLGSLAVSLLSVFTGTMILPLLFFVLAMVFYSIILFSIFVSTDKLMPKLAAIAIFMCDVILGTGGLFMKCFGIY